MIARRRQVWLPLASLVGVVFLVIVGVSRLKQSTIRGIVLADEGPVGGAVVRVQGEADFTLTDAQGGFVLSGADANAHITAWAPGFYITVGQPPASGDLILVLRRHPTEDNPAYQFVSPVIDDNNPAACGRCHAAKPGAPDVSLPAEEWLMDAHSRSAVNPRFLSLYNGTTVDGEMGSLTTFHFDSSLGIEVPVAPSLGQSGVGPGFRLDFPDEIGSCANCHVPILALINPYQANPNEAQGVAAEGITCDFCHKIAAVRLLADDKPSPHLPGVQSLVFLRPNPDEQVFLGPFDDTPGDDIYSPLQNESQLCAACHTGTFWGVTMYDSFGEWLASPYSDPQTGKTCQDCHMPHRGVTQFVQLPPEVTQYVPQRDPQTIFSHRMPGAADIPLLQDSVELTVEAHLANEELQVSVQVTNTGAGHSIPTDSPLRNMILLVQAYTPNGQSLNLIEGSTIPEWGGVGNFTDGHYAGQPGVLYAKVLADYYTGELPTAAYWRQTRLVSDNRIAALASDQSSYRFSVPSEVGEITVDVQLLFRRAFIQLMELKGWNVPDILMEQETACLNP